MVVFDCSGSIYLIWKSCSIQLIQTCPEMTVSLSPWSHHGQCNRCMNIEAQGHEQRSCITQKNGINLTKNLLAAVTDGYANISSREHGFNLTPLVSEICQQINHIGTSSLCRDNDFVPTEIGKYSGYWFSFPTCNTLDYSATEGHIGN